jgi:hypothetical protein
MIAQPEARFRDSNLLGKAWAGFLAAAIAYAIDRSVRCCGPSRWPFAAVVLGMASVTGRQAR